MADWAIFAIHNQNESTLILMGDSKQYILDNVFYALGEYEYKDIYDWHYFSLCNWFIDYWLQVRRLPILHTWRRRIVPQDTLVKDYWD